MTERKKIKLGPLYFLGFFMLFFSEESEILTLLGVFTIAFTSLAHFIFKIVTQQDEFKGGMTQQGFVAKRPMFSSRTTGTHHYDQLIRKMQITDLSGMSVDQAASTYASFFKYPVVSSKPFFSSPYVQEVLSIGTQVSAQTIGVSSTPKPTTSPSSSGAFWSSMPESSTEAIEICADPSCSTPVTVFDFRCFKCRKRFCSECKGYGVTCQQCS
tara:strand:- start:3058 stop:3696 length:639 start_codon:yes stop_codon:yes gene_type:complete